MITVTLQGATVQDIQEQMRHFLVGALINPNATLSGRTQTAGAIEAMDEIASHSDPDMDHGQGPVDADMMLDAKETLAPEKVKRTRKAKAPVAASSPEKETASPTKTEAAESKTKDLPIVVASKEAVHQALQQVNVAIGLNKAREILGEFKAQRTSEVKPEQYTAFINKCNEAVMMHG